MMDVLSILGQMAESSGDPRVRTLMKALTSTQQGTNLSSLTGGGALRAESLETDLALATVKNEHFKIYNRLFAGRKTTWSLIDQKVVQDSIGGFPGSSISNETGSNMSDRNGNYSRVITECKLFNEYGSVTVPTALQSTIQAGAGIVDFTAQEQEVFSALTRVLSSVEWSILFGDKSIDSLEFTGLIPAITAQASSNVVDARGAAVNTGAAVSSLAARLSTYGKFGAVDVAYMSPLVKADFDAHLESNYRVNLDANIPNTTLGAMVKGVRYNALSGGSGMFDLEPHIFLDENMRAPRLAYAPDGVSGNAPASVAAVASAASNDYFESDHAGAYYYCVEAAGAGYCSAPTVSSAAVTVAAGNKVVLTIAQSSDGAETYYNVYRSKQGGSNTAADMRFIGRVVKGGTTTTFTDLNTSIPGTSNIIMLTTGKEADALRWLQMIPPAKIPMAMTTLAYRFACLYIAALRVTLPKKHGMLINVLPSSATWKPFTS
ncbi:MAG TPA: hypothetical protein VN436_04130 [Holophaga sp.]|nr:hypothetical protein [Holophaga sp.]